MWVQIHPGKHNKARIVCIVLVICIFFAKWWKVTVKLSIFIILGRQMVSFTVYEITCFEWLICQLFCTLWHGFAAVTHFRVKFLKLNFIPNTLKSYHLRCNCAIVSLFSVYENSFKWDRIQFFFFFFFRIRNILTLIFLNGTFCCISESRTIRAMNASRLRWSTPRKTGCLSFRFITREKWSSLHTPLEGSSCHKR